MRQIGKYQILERIGTGGFAVVYRGYDPDIKRHVAIKLCHSRDEEIRQRFHREAEIAGSLIHPNIALIYDFGVYEQMPYLVEEFLSGEDLAHLIQRQEPAAIGTRVASLLQILRGLRHAHAHGVIHRDIKPANVRVLESGELKLMDFGTAKLADVESQLTQTGVTLGTVAYLAPERLRGKPARRNSDLFSIGVLAFELLSFRRPFAGKNVADLIEQVLEVQPPPLDRVWPDCPRGLAPIVARCLAKDPDARYETCDDVLADLEAVAREIPGAVPTVDADAAAPGAADLKISGLLERAEELVEGMKLARAQVLLDEVLEMAPDHRRARQLAMRLAAAADAEADRGDDLSPRRRPLDARRATKVADAVQTVERLIDDGRWSEAIDALAFGERLLGPIPGAPALRRRVAQGVAAERGDLIRRAERCLSRIGDRAQKILHRQTVGSRARARLAHWIAELGATPHLAAQRRAAQDHVDALARSARRSDAARTIEAMLDRSAVDEATEALELATSMYGDSDALSRLRERIAMARAPASAAGLS